MAINVATLLLMPHAASAAPTDFGFYFVFDVSELDTLATFSTSIFIGNGGNVLGPTSWDGGKWVPIGPCKSCYLPCAVPLLAAADAKNLSSLAARNMTGIVSVSFAQRYKIRPFPCPTCHCRPSSILRCSSIETVPFKWRSVLEVKD